MNEQRVRAEQALRALAESQEQTAAGREVIAAHEYGSAIRAVHRDWENGDLRAMHARLDATDPNRRGWEWHYLRRLSDRSLVTLRGGCGGVLVVVFSPDGTRILTAGDGSKPRLWDAATGQLLFELVGHLEKAQSAAFTPDGQFVVTATTHGATRVWNATTGEAVAERTGLRVHDRYPVSFDRNGGRVLASQQEHIATVWAPDQPGAVHLFRVADLRGHTGFVQSAAFSPDEKRVLTASWDGNAKVWDAKTGAELLTLRGHTKGVRAAVFSRDGKRIATAGVDGRAKVWDAKTGAELLTLLGHTDAVLGVAFRDDGGQLLTAGEDGTARVWDAVTGAERNVIRGHRGLPIRAASFSPDGTRVVTAGADGTVKVWPAERADDFNRLTPPDADKRYVRRAFSPDWTRMATVTENELVVVVSSVATGAESTRLVGHTGRIGCIAFSPDGTQIATGGDDKTARLWDAKTGAELLVIRDHSGVGRVAFRPDGAAILTGRSLSQPTTLWDAKTGANLRDYEQYRGPHGTWSFGDIPPIPYSPDGRRLVSTNIERAGVWDAATGEQQLVLVGDKLRPYEMGIISAAFSPDGTRVVGAGRYSHGPSSALVWDVRPGSQPAPGPSTTSADKKWEAFHRKPSLVMKGHIDAVYTATFSPDGSRILTAGKDRTAKIWDAATGVELLSLDTGTAPIWGAEFSPDGTRIRTVCDFGEVRIWDGRPSQERVEPGR